MQTINPYTRKPVTRDGWIDFYFGQTGSGKTTGIKNALIKSSCPLPKFAFDLSGEYAQFGVKPVDLKGRTIKQAAYDFRNLMINKWESVIIFSEAGIYFKNRQQMDEEMSLILKEARKRGNWVFMDFHKLSEIPVDMLGLSDRLVMRKTTMETGTQIKKFYHYREIIDSYRSVMADTNRFAVREIYTKKLKVKI